MVHDYWNDKSSIIFLVDFQKLLLMWVQTPPEDRVLQKLLLMWVQTSPEDRVFQKLLLMWVQKSPEENISHLHLRGGYSEYILTENCVFLFFIQSAARVWDQIDDGTR